MMRKTVLKNIIIFFIYFKCLLIHDSSAEINNRDTRGINYFGRRNWNGPLTASGRFLSLFTLVQWDRGLCTVPSGEYGNCVPNNECLSRGGIPGGPCAEGYGICCVFMTSCGGIARENGTYFINPNHPDAYENTGSCQLTIIKTHPEICQIRLDFEQFNIAGPEEINHICNTDQFLVSGGSPVPTICGKSNGDHMYIDAGLGQSNPITLTIITSGSTFQRTWRIRISQIPCFSVWKADQGCLQYHTGVNGRIKSFNFDTTSGRQLSNQDYSICMRTERNFCNIQFTACADRNTNNRSRSFTLSGNSNTIVNSMVGSGTTGAQNACTNDWLLIGCARVADRVPLTTVCEDRLCGGTFNAEISNIERTVTSNIRPFRVAFHTDSIEAPIDVDNRGFCLDYVQQPCTNH